MQTGSRKESPVLEDEVNQDVIKLWYDTYAADANVLMPMVYPTLSTNSLLFVGLNPSFSLTGFQKFLPGSPYVRNYARDLFPLAKPFRI